MNHPLIDFEPSAANDLEVRRIHERYQCTGLTAYFNTTASSYLKPVEGIRHTACIEDISINGLAMMTDKSLSQGELLYLEIDTPDETANERINAQVMWCKSSANNQYSTGLRIVSNSEISQQPTTKRETTTSNELTCSHCGEASFYLEVKRVEASQPSQHSCCRCGHSHYITRVMAFNRK